MRCEMSSDEKRLGTYTSGNLDEYLKEVAKEYRKMGGKSMPAEIILIGGAAVIANYGFREMTTDIDAIIHATSAMKDAINIVGDRHHLQNGWLNTDFLRTASYSPKLEQYSTYYRTFGGVMSVRTVQAEYLIAMKLRSGRLYKNDQSDIVGILEEHVNRGEPIAMDRITQAVTNLYGGWEQIPESSRLFLQKITKSGNYQKEYGVARQEEINNKKRLIEFEDKYPGVTTSENVDKIIKNLKKKDQDRSKTIGVLLRRKQEVEQEVEEEEDLER